MKKFAVVWALVLVLQGCSSGANVPDGSDLAVKVVTEKGEFSYGVELAQTTEEQRLGLMNRDSLDKDKGMLFVFKQPQELSFWMKNMRFNLDIIFISADKKVLNIADSVIPCIKDPCSNYVSKGVGQYVLELGGGQAKEIGLKEGDLIDFSL